MLELENDCKRLPDDNHLRILSGEAGSHSPSIRRIIPSEDVGIVLLGNLKVCISSAILFLILATKLLYIQCMHSSVLFICTR